MTTKHTAGPWSFDGTLIRAGFVVSAPGKRAKQIVALVEAVVGYEADPTPEAEANARLIAAAPDLLEACDKARLVFATMRGMPPSDQLIEELCGILEVAIAKATTP